MLIALAGCAAAAGALLARQAPVLLGPTPADRLAAAERRATDWPSATGSPASCTTRSAMR